MGRHEEVSCQCEVRGWNSCAHGQGEKSWGRRGERKGQCYPIHVMTLHLGRQATDVTLETVHSEFKLGIFPQQYINKIFIF